MSVASIFETMSYGTAPEARDVAERWLEEHDRRFGLYIEGKWVAPKSEEYFRIVNPADGADLASIAQAGSADVAEAVKAARRAFPSWSSTPGHVRSRYMYGLARAVQRHSRLLAVLESLDNGKPIRESRDLDIPLVARHFYHYAGWAQLMAEEFAEYSPLGVIGQIIPWNFPLLMLAWKIAPALAMGNTVVLKPAEYTPLTALAFAEIIGRSGLPPGVVNIITGDGRTGELLVGHEDVDKIAFTGSTEVGRAIRRETAGSQKRISLELGGKSPFLVFDDADLDSVVEGVVDAIWFNQGQVCCAGSRLLVQESIEERLLTKLRARMERLRVGDPLDKGIDIGAIIAPVQLERIERLVSQGEAEGACIWQPSWSCPTEGYFYPPTLLTNVSPAATIAQVEIFGPVLVSMTFRTPGEAVALANNTSYGLAASIWSENVNLALDIAGQIKAGTVWINCTNLFDAASGFGGYRESGFGREGGKEGLYEYVKESDSVCRAPVGSDAQQEPPPNQSLALSTPIDRTAKLYVGGRQTRPDSGYSRPVHGRNGDVIGEVGEGNRKDIRNAVEASRAASSWIHSTGHMRAQVLYYFAENLSSRDAELTRRLQVSTGCTTSDAVNEFAATLDRIFTYAAWADKFDGMVHDTPYRGLTLAVNEALGTLGIVCPDENPLLSFVHLVSSAICVGNAVVVVPSESHPLIATDLYQVMETSDVPAGVVNIVTGDRNSLATVLAEHDDVEGLWYFGDDVGAQKVEFASAGNLKRTWTQTGQLDWLGSWARDSRKFLREASQVKNIWVPVGA